MRQDDKKIAKLFYIIGIAPVIWTALLVAPYINGGIIGILKNSSNIFTRPFNISFTENSIKTVLIFLLIYLLAILVYESTRKNYRRREENGSAKWGDAKELNKKYKQSNNYNKILTKNVSIGLNGKKHRRNVNVLVIGGSGAGKTFSYCKPNIMQCATSYVVLDPKGEILRDSGYLLEKNAEIEEIKKEKERAKKEYMQKRNKKKAIVLSISIFLYCIATFALPYMTEVLRYEDAHAVMIWATLCTIATVIIVYFFVAYPNMYKEEKENKGIKDDIEELNDEIEEIEKLDDGRIKIEAVGAESKTEALAIQIVASLFLIIYLLVSFLTGAWHITWILWIVFIFVELIVKLIFSMKGEKENNEK